jgi:hypothetical protein
VLSIRGVSTLFVFGGDVEVVVLYFVVLYFCGVVRCGVCVSCTWKDNIKMILVGMDWINLARIPFMATTCSYTHP